MANRGRGFMSGGVWDGEYESQTDIDVKARLDDLEGAVDPGDTGTTYSGVPQPATPYMIAQRADPNGKIFTTVRFTSISNNLKRFWFTHKMIRPDGTYGEAQVQRVDVTAAMIAGDSCQVEIEHAFRANRTIHLVKIKGKFTTTVSDDGGNTDQNPPEATYVDEQSPGETSQTELASFSTGAGVVGPQVDNEVYNSKLKWNAPNYIKPDGVTDNQGGTAPANALGMFRRPLVGQQRGGDPTRFVTTAAAELNYWINSGSVAPAIAFTGGSVDQDVCCKTQQTPWDNSEPFMCGAVLLRVGVFSALDLDFSLWVFLEDSVQGRIASARIAGVGAKASSSQWQFVQFDEATVSSSYSPGAASRQWIRWGLRQTSLVGGTLSGGRQILMYKPQAGNMVGAWKPHSNDRVQTNDPTSSAPTGGGGRGSAGVGITGHETPAGEGGQVIRGNVN